MARRKKETARRPDRKTIQSQLKVNTLEKEWVDFNPAFTYHLHRKLFKIKALRGKVIQLTKRVRLKDGTPTDKYMARLLVKAKGGWKEGNLIKVTKHDVKSDWPDERRRLKLGISRIRWWKFKKAEESDD